MKIEYRHSKYPPHEISLRQNEMFRAICCDALLDEFAAIALRIEGGEYIPNCPYCKQEIYVWELARIERNKNGELMSRTIAHTEMTKNGERYPFVPANITDEEQEILFVTPVRDAILRAVSGL